MNGRGILLLSAVVTAALVAGASGCKRRPAAPAGAPGERLTIDQALQLVQDLPEVGKWSDQVRRARGQPVSMLVEAPTDEDEFGGAPAYVFELSESRGRGKTLWNRFRVDAASGDVFVWEPVAQQYLSVGLWRVKTGGQ